MGDDIEIFDTDKHELPTNKFTSCAGDLVELSTVIDCENDIEKKNSSSIDFFIIKDILESTTIGIINVLNKMLKKKRIKKYNF